MRRVEILGFRRVLRPVKKNLTARLATAEGRRDVRFDDSLGTVLSADMSTPFGAQATWRQLVDLLGRGRVIASDAAIALSLAMMPAVESALWF